MLTTDSRVGRATEPNSWTYTSSRGDWWLGWTDITPWSERTIAQTRAILVSDSSYTHVRYPERRYVYLSCEFRSRELDFSRILTFDVPIYPPHSLKWPIWAVDIGAEVGIGVEKSWVTVIVDLNAWYGVSVQEKALGCFYIMPKPNPGTEPEVSRQFLNEMPQNWCGVFFVRYFVDY